jgi:hypothetical protein
MQILSQLLGIQVDKTKGEYPQDLSDAIRSVVFGDSFRHLMLVNTSNDLRD